MGRPTSYRAEYAEQSAKLARLGATDKEIADFLDVHVDTVYEWKKTHAEFSESLKGAKEEADARVVRSLFQRAIGFERDAVKIFCSKDGGVTKVPYREFVNPDTTACIFWLKNRRPAEWRDRIQHAGLEGDGLVEIVVRHIGGGDASD